MFGCSSCEKQMACWWASFMWAIKSKHSIQFMLKYLNCLGDLGYALNAGLMTPFANPVTPQEVCFNHVHSHMSTVIEHTFGLLKGHWTCLDTAAAKLLYPPENVCRIILACCGILLPPGTESQLDHRPHGTSRQGCRSVLPWLNAMSLMIVS